MDLIAAVDIRHNSSGRHGRRKTVSFFLLRWLSGRISLVFCSRCARRSRLRARCDKDHVIRVKAFPSHRHPERVDSTGGSRKPQPGSTDRVRPTIPWSSTPSNDVRWTPLQVLHLPVYRQTPVYVRKFAGLGEEFAGRWYRPAPMIMTGAISLALRLRQAETAV